MQDQPTPAEILSAVAAFLRDVVIAQATPHTGFQARVAANALDLVARQIEQAPATDAEEQARLVALLGRDGSLADLNRALSDGLSSGAFDATTPALLDHLRATTLAKLAIDQPNYSGYRAALADAAQPKEL